MNLKKNREKIILGIIIIKLYNKVLNYKLFLVKIISSNVIVFFKKIIIKNI